MATSGRDFPMVSAQAANILRGLGYKRVTDGGAIATARPEYSAD